MSRKHDKVTSAPIAVPYHIPDRIKEPEDRLAYVKPGFSPKDDRPSWVTIVVVSVIIILAVLGIIKYVPSVPS